MLRNLNGQLPGDLETKSDQSKAIIIVRRLEEIAEKSKVFLICYQPELAATKLLSL